MANKERSEVRGSVNSGRVRWLTAEGLLAESTKGAAAPLFETWGKPGCRGLVADGGAVVARIGGAAAFVGFGVDTDGVDQADMTTALYFVTA